MHIGSSTAEMPVKFQSDIFIITSNTVASRLREASRKTFVCLVNRSPDELCSERKHAQCFKCSRLRLQQMKPPGAMINGKQSDKNQTKKMRLISASVMSKWSIATISDSDQRLIAVTKHHKDNQFQTQKTRRLSTLILMNYSSRICLRVGVIN